MTAQERRTRRRYMPGIDGLRAVSVLVVIGYHLNVPFFDGGFVGVDFFFVISGFLITDLLVAEWREHGRIDLKQFWVRRARRLLPALWLVLGAVASVSAAVTLLGGEVAAGLRGNVLAALAYVSNWWQIAEDAAYTAHFDGAMPPLMHLWSLAVEEQFYLLWPLLLLALVWLLRHRAVVASVVIALAAGSTALMWLTFQPGDDSSRAYYGTDTHAFGLFLGAFLAIAFGATRLRRVGAWTSLSVQILGLLSFVGFAFLVVTLTEDGAAAYHGGIALSSAAAACMIAGVVVPGVLGRGFGTGLLRWIGVRSYGIYLWHWPAIAFVDLARTGWLPTSLAESLAVRVAAGALVVAVTMGLAAFSWRYVERPAQQLGIFVALRTLYAGVVARSSSVGHRVAPLAVTGVAALAIAGCLIAPQSSQLQDQLDDGRDAITRAASTPSSSAKPRPAPTASPGEQDTPAPVEITGEQITAIGDSVMLASAGALTTKMPGIYVDADDSRSMVVAPGILSGLKSRGELRDVVVVGVTDNGGVSKSSVDSVVDIVGEQRLLILVNTPVEDSWTDEANELLEDTAADNDNVRVADWKTWADHHPDHLLEDGVHPQSSGAEHYARLIYQAAQDPPTSVIGPEPSTSPKSPEDKDSPADNDTDDPDDSEDSEDSDTEVPPDPDTSTPPEDDSTPPEDPGEDDTGEPDPSESEEPSPSESEEPEPTESEEPEPTESEEPSPTETNQEPTPSEGDGPTADAPEPPRAAATTHGAGSSAARRGSSGDPGDNHGSAPPTTGHAPVATPARR